MLLIVIPPSKKTLKDIVGTIKKINPNWPPLKLHLCTVSLCEDWNVKDKGVKIDVKSTHRG